MRVLDASYNAPALDACVSARPIALNVVGPSVTTYAYAGPGAVTVRLDAQGATNVLQSLTGMLMANTQYSIFVTGMGKNFTATLLTDQSTAARNSAPFHAIPAGTSLISAI